MWGHLVYKSLHGTSSTILAKQQQQQPERGRHRPIKGANQITREHSGHECRLAHVSLPDQQTQIRPTSGPRDREPVSEASRRWLRPRATKTFSSKTDSSAQRPSPLLICVLRARCTISGCSLISFSNFFLSCFWVRSPLNNILDIWSNDKLYIWIPCGRGRSGRKKRRGGGGGRRQAERAHLRTPRHNPHARHENARHRQHQQGLTRSPCKRTMMS